MHELLLLGQVPANRQAQVLGVLSGLTAAQPQRVVERHVLFRPLRNAPSEGPQKGGTQVIAANKAAQSATGKELFHLRLVKKVVQANFGRGDGDEASSKTVDDEPKTASNEGWEMVFRDIPEPGKRSASLRMVQQIPIQGDDPMRFMELQGYKYGSG
jgi:mediator of RNA polymerase II transcription subunit 18